MTEENIKYGPYQHKHMEMGESRRTDRLSVHPLEAMVILVEAVHRSGSSYLNLDCHDVFTADGEPLGNWEIMVKRKDSVCADMPKMVEAACEAFNYDERFESIEEAMERALAAALLEQSHPASR